MLTPAQCGNRCQRGNILADALGATNSDVVGNRILFAGQHRGSTSAIQTALNTLVAN